jgi:hypothetical protein
LVAKVATLFATVGNKAQKADVDGVKEAVILIFLQFKSEADKMAARLTSLKVGCCFLVRWSFVCRAHPVGGRAAAAVASPS